MKANENYNLASYVNTSMDIRYSILHGWQSLPERLPSDLDIAIAPEDLKKLERRLRDNGNGELVQLLQHETSCYYFVLAVGEENWIRFIPVDTAVDYRRDGRVYFTAKELLAGRQEWNGLWVAAPEVEFAYLLVKKVSKGALPDHQKVRLQVLHELLSEEAYSVARRLFGTRWGEHLLHWLTHSDWATFEANLPSLKRALRWEVVKRDPLNPLRYWIPEIKRVWRRWWYPTGLFVVVLGPDGAGKSTLIQHLQKNLGGAFRRTTVFHFRPSLFGRDKAGGSETNPHGKSPRPWLLSVLKIHYYLFDYVLGYLLKVRTHLVHSTLVLFDRYYDDLLVDPYRYRYDGPQWLIKLARKFIPQTDLFLILDVPEEQLLARKQEVSLDEMRRQREAYRQLAMELPDAVLLDGSSPAKKVARNASEVALDYLHERYFKRRHLWFNSDLETIDWLSSILSSDHEEGHFAELDAIGKNSKAEWQTNDSFGWLKIKDGRGYLIPLKFQKAGVRALDLYNAQNSKARIAKKLLTIGLKLNMSRFLLPRVYMTIRRDVNAKENSKILLEHIKDVLKIKDLTFAISLGTPGPHRKPVIQLVAPDGKTLGYAKVGWNEATNVLVKREAEILQQLSNVPFNSFLTPSVLYAGWWADRFICIQSCPGGKTEFAPQRLTSHYLFILKELADFHKCQILHKESSFWKNLLQRIESIQSAYYRYVLEQGVCRVEKWLGNASLPFHMRHGDFAPWNAYKMNGKLFLFDWEYADREALGGWDLFHFIVQTLWLLEKRTPPEIYNAVLKNEMNSQFMETYLEYLGLDKDAIHILFSLYLLDRLAFYASEKKTGFHKLQHLTNLVSLCVYGKEHQ